MDLRNASHPAVATTPPRSARAAGMLLMLLGVANVAVAGWGLAAGPDEIATGLAIGLGLAGAGTVVLGRLVARGHRVAVYVALIVFELLLIPRLVTLGEPGTGTWASLLLLVGLVALLWVAAVAVRRTGSGPAERDPAGSAGGTAL